MIILGETHFGSTWWMYFEKKNIKWALNNKIYSIYYPMLILFFLTTVAITISLNASLFIILLFNFFHVTRQSAGIIKIYLENEEERVRAILINNFLYLISLALVFFGLLKFVFKIDAIKEYNEIVNILSILFLGLSILYFWFFLRFKNLKAILCYITGVLIWMPLIWVDKIYHAFAMGVGMHYIQYLAITIAIYARKNEEKLDNKIKFIILFFIYLLTYSLIMVGLSNLDFFKTYYLFLIPIFFQTLHFYADMFTWKFSNFYIRENVAKYMYSLKK
jgi:hypothetical protein